MDEDRQLLSQKMWIYALLEGLKYYMPSNTSELGYYVNYSIPSNT
jgi:hypothetical protein